MICKKESMLLYAVTDRSWVGKQTLLDQVEAALKGGITCLQLREKDMNEVEFFYEAMEMRKLCTKYQVPFIINDNVDIAIRCRADGIHVGQSDMKTNKVRELVGDHMIIGVSVQTIEQAVEAYKAGADYLGVGAMFRTTTKLDASEVSYETLKEICKAVSIPKVAIGGINKSNIMNLSGTGVDGGALVSAIFAAKDIELECRELYSLSQKMIKA